MIIKSGTVIDPSSGLHDTCDVAVARGRIAAVGPNLGDDAPEVFDATGSIVTPGLVDLHAHIFTGITNLGVDADIHSLAKGVTTVIDAGSAGANTFAGFREFVMSRVQARTLAFLNISAMGMIDNAVGELLDLRWAMVDRAVEVARANADKIVGVKVRLSQELVGGNAVGALDRALAVGAEIGRPIMVHIGATPISLGDILDRLRPGDVLTHSFTGRKPGIIGDDGRVIAPAIDARKRGVVFDVGHGQGSFTFAAAEAALEQQFMPDTISSDLHRFNVDGPVFDLVTTLSKFLYLGMSLEEVIELATARPRAVVGHVHDFGSFQSGLPADLAVLHLENRGVIFRDAEGRERRGEQFLKPILTIREGKRVTPVGGLAAS